MSKVGIIDIKKCNSVKCKNTDISLNGKNINTSINFEKIIINNYKEKKTEHIIKSNEIEYNENFLKSNFNKNNDKKPDNIQCILDKYKIYFNKCKKSIDKCKYFSPKTIICHNPPNIQIEDFSKVIIKNNLQHLSVLKLNSKKLLFRKLERELNLYKIMNFIYYYLYLLNIKLYLNYIKILKKNINFHLKDENINNILSKVDLELLNQNQQFMKINNLDTFNLCTLSVNDDKYIDKNLKIQLYKLKKNKFNCQINNNFIINYKDD